MSSSAVVNASPLIYLARKDTRHSLMIFGNPVDQIQTIHRPEVLSPELQHHKWVPGTICG
jgi:hypothetical protein